MNTSKFEESYLTDWVLGKDTFQSLCGTGVASFSIVLQSVTAADLFGAVMPYKRRCKCKKHALRCKSERLIAN